jgi:hypothetical protein
MSGIITCTRSYFKHHYSGVREFLRRPTAIRPHRCRIHKRCTERWHWLYNQALCVCHYTVTQIEIPCMLRNSEIIQVQRQRRRPHGIRLYTQRTGASRDLPHAVHACPEVCKAVVCYDIVRSHSHFITFISPGTQEKHLDMPDLS